MSLKDALLEKAKDKLGRHREEVTELFRAAGWEKQLGGCRVFAQRMSGKARSTYEDYRDIYGPDPARGFGAVKRVDLNARNLDAILAVRCLADEAGNLIFAETDADLFGEADSELIGFLARTCERINGMVAAEPLKNAPTGGGSGSPPEATDSPPTNSAIASTASS